MMIVDRQALTTVPRNSRMVLLVDHSRAQRRTLAVQLIRAGYHVVEASNSEEAMAICLERRCTSRQVVRCRSPSTRRETISVSPWWRSACTISDEIDSGISGQIGTAVAVKMRQIAKNHQVLCITHLPQIAAYANHQYLVYKEETGEHTRSNAIQLTQQQRAREIARIMGSVGEDAVALEHAQQLIDAAEEAMRRIF